MKASQLRQSVTAAITAATSILVTANRSPSETLRLVATQAAAAYQFCELMHEYAHLDPLTKEKGVAEVKSRDHQNDPKAIEYYKELGKLLQPQLIYIRPTVTDEHGNLSSHLGYGIPKSVTYEWFHKTVGLQAFGPKTGVGKSASMIAFYVISTLASYVRRCYDEGIPVAKAANIGLHHSGDIKPYLAAANVAMNAAILMENSDHTAIAPILKNWRATFKDIPRLVSMDDETLASVIAGAYAGFKVSVTTADGNLTTAVFSGNKLITNHLPVMPYKPNKVNAKAELAFLQENNKAFRAMIASRVGGVAEPAPVAPPVPRVTPLTPVMPPVAPVAPKIAPPATSPLSGIVPWPQVAADFEKLKALKASDWLPHLDQDIRDALAQAGKAITDLRLYVYNLEDRARGATFSAVIYVRIDGHSYPKSSYIEIQRNKWSYDYAFKLAVEGMNKAFRSDDAKARREKPLQSIIDITDHLRSSPLRQVLVDWSGVNHILKPELLAELKTNNLNIDFTFHYVQAVGPKEVRVVFSIGGRRLSDLHTIKPTEKAYFALPEWDTVKAIGKLRDIITKYAVELLGMVGGDTMHLADARAAIEQAAAGAPQPRTFVKVGVEHEINDVKFDAKTNMLSFKFAVNVFDYRNDYKPMGTMNFGIVKVKYTEAELNKVVGDLVYRAVAQIDKNYRNNLEQSFR